MHNLKQRLAEIKLSKVKNIPAENYVQTNMSYGNLH